jgi:hypothetical protein
MADSTERTWQDNKEAIMISYLQVWDKSFQSKFEEFGRWWHPTFLHVQLFRCIVESHEKAELSNSLVYRRFLGWRRTLHWCILSAHSGVYEAIARELRFIIEDLAQALYIEQKLGDSEIISKVRTASILEDVRLRGTPLIEKIDMNNETRKEMKRLYFVLCDYVHPSADLVQQILTSDGYFVKFDDAQYHSLLDLYTQTCDLVISLVISRFPKSIERFLWLRSSREEVIEGLKEEGYSLTARACERGVE